MSQTELASAVGITFQQVQKYERGSNRVSFSRLVEIAHALSCRAVDLIGELDDGVPNPSIQRDTAHLQVKGASDLIAAYADMPPALRNALLKLLVEMAKSSRSLHRAGEPAPSPKKVPIAG
jgi:transcriptional regulator with XRE-family HTH domain